MTAHRPTTLVVVVTLLYLTLMIQLGCGGSSSSSNSGGNSNAAAPATPAPGSSGSGSGGGSGSAGSGSGTGGTPAPAPAGGTYVYVANSSSHDISAFRMDSDGKLTAIPESPFAFPATSMTLSSGYLITAPGRALKIDPGTGNLTQAGTADAGNGVFVAADSSTAYFCGNDGIHSFTFANGSFTAVPGSPFLKPDPSNPASCRGLAIASALYLLSSSELDLHHAANVQLIKRLPGGVLSPDISLKGLDHGGPVVAHPDGRAFYVYDDPGLLAYAIDGDGHIGDLVTNNVFLTGNPLPLAIDAAGKYLFAGEGAKVHVYAINSSTAGFSEVAGSPFASGGNGANGIAVDPSGKFVVVSNGQFFVSAPTNTVSVMALNSSTGTLTPVGAPVSAGSGPGSVVIAHF